MPFTAPQQPGRAPRGSGLFTEQPAEAAAAPATVGPTREDMARPTLFQRMTSRVRRQLDAASGPQEPAVPVPAVSAPRRTEPMLQQAEPRPEPVRAAVRQASSEEMGILDIPTFLRRQSS